MDFMTLHGMFKMYDLLKSSKRNDELWVAVTVTSGHEVLFFLFAVWVIAKMYMWVMRLLLIWRHGSIHFQKWMAFRVFLLFETKSVLVYKSWSYLQVKKKQLKHDKNVGKYSFQQCHWRTMCFSRKTFPSRTLWPFFLFTIFNFFSIIIVLQNY